MANDFLQNLIKAVPYRIHTLLTDNGIQFANYGSHEQLKSHLQAFLMAYNFARRLKALKGLTQRTRRPARCCFQSLFAPARLNHLEPLAWLQDTLEKLPVWPNNRLDELLPITSLPLPRPRFNPGLPNQGDG